MKKLSEVIDQVLSDALYETVFDPELASKRMKFVQRLLQKYADLNRPIDLNAEWNKFDVA